MKHTCTRIQYTLDSVTFARTTTARCDNCWHIQLRAATIAR